MNEVKDKVVKIINMDFLEKSNQEQMGEGYMDKEADEQLTTSDDLMSLDDGASAENKVVKMLKDLPRGDKISAAADLEILWQEMAKGDNGIVTGKLQSSVPHYVISAMEEFRSCAEVQRLGCAILIKICHAEPLEVTNIVRFEGLEAALGAVKHFSDKLAVGYGCFLRKEGRRQASCHPSSTVAMYVLVE
jgi:hypothetical protein